MLSEAIDQRPPRVNILGVGVHALSLDRATRLTFNFIANGCCGYICITGVHGIVEAQSDRHLQNVLNRSFLTTPDGMPTVWIGHWQGHSDMTRVYGPDFMLECFDHSQELGYRHFLYGGKPGVAEQLAQSLRRRFPRANIVGTYTPPFRRLTGDEETELIKLVRESKPHVLWCGLSTPKQEMFMAEYIGRLPVQLMVGVGAAFDIHTGLIADAPAWMKRTGLQWLHRVMQEPKRLSGRYLRNNPRFIWLLTLQALGLRQFGSSDLK